jgi:ABC-type sugar transport system substrate-binding protein
MKKRIIALASGAILALSLSACATGGGGGDGNGDDAPTIGVMLLNGDTYFTNVASGVTAANPGDTIVENFDGDAAKEAQAVDNLVARGVDAIITSPLDGEASAVALQRAADAGIKIVCYNTCVNDPENGEIVSAFVLSDQAGMGTATGEFAATWIAANITDPLNIGIIHCDTYDICRERRDAFFAALDAAGVTYSIVAEDEEIVVDKAVPKAENMLTAHPEINVLWGANDGSTTGLVKAVQSSGRDVVVFGSDMTPVLAELLLEADPTLLTTTGQDGIATGEAAVGVVNSLLAGDSVDPFIQVVPVANYSIDDLDAVQAYLDSNG